MESKILLIEDDPAIQMGIKEMLLLENFNVITASDGKEGLNLALQEMPDLILLDFNLPTLNGMQILRKLKENGFPNAVIMLTSRAEQIDKVLGLELGANDYMTKPFDSRELLARINAQLRVMERISNKTKQELNLQEEKSKRRLLAILFTDIKDYSKKMGANEALAIRLLEIHNEIIKEIVLINEGRIVEIIGDAFLVTFESALKSTECAYEIQQKLKAYNESVTNEEHIEVRIGIHLGDVIEYDNNIKGDAVNIAARIQQNAAPGGVTISESVYTAVKNKVSFNIVFSGEQNFKNIKEPVTLYVVEI